MEEEIHPIELFLISGFLGSGKTTFLKNVLSSAEGVRTGVIVNEFGSVGIDGTLVRRNGIELQEISSGSIFCSCLKAGFVKTLFAFSKEPIDVLYIESSGMSDPSSMKKLLEHTEKFTVRPYRYRGCICLIDPLTFPDYADLLPSVKSQAETASFLVVNKIDLADHARIAEAEEMLHQINPEAYLFESMYGKVPLQLLREKIFDNGFVRESTNSPDNRFMTYSVESRGKISRTGLERFIRAEQNRLIRLKGFAETEDGWIHADLASGQLTFSPMEQTEGTVQRKNRIVLIADSSAPFYEEVKKNWELYCGNEEDIFE